MMRHYKLSDLVAACSMSEKVTVWDIAVDTAMQDFGLNSEAEVLEFVATEGWDQAPRWINTVKLIKPPHAPVDAYEFFSGTRYGYLAFFLSPITQQWNIKSFKKNDNPDPRLSQRGGRPVGKAGV